MTQTIGRWFFKIILVHLWANDKPTCWYPFVLSASLRCNKTKQCGCTTTPEPLLLLQFLSIYFLCFYSLGQILLSVWQEFTFYKYCPWMTGSFLGSQGIQFEAALSSCQRLAETIDIWQREFVDVQSPACAKLYPGSPGNSKCGVH